jgi:hypothetical protein
MNSILQYKQISAVGPFSECSSCRIHYLKFQIGRRGRGQLGGGGGRCLGGRGRPRLGSTPARLRQRPTLQESEPVQGEEVDSLLLISKYLFHSFLRVSFAAEVTEKVELLGADELVLGKPTIIKKPMKKERRERRHELKQNQAPSLWVSHFFFLFLLVTFKFKSSFSVPPYAAIPC